MRIFPKIFVSTVLLISIGAFAQIGSAQENSNAKANPAAQALANSAKIESKVAPAATTPSSSPAQTVPTASATSAVAAPNGNNDFVDFIVAFQPGVSRANSNSLVSGGGGKVLAEISYVFNGAIVNGPRARMQSLVKNPNVRYVEEDMEVTASAQQINPPSWGLDRIDQRPNKLDNVYDDFSSQGAGVIAYVVDTGIDKSKSDISSRVLAGVSYISDRYGTSDCNGHGTHVSGTIAGTTYGVAKLANLVPVRVLDCRGSGSIGGVVKGLDWILNPISNKNPINNAVVNMSLGGGISTSLDDAVNRVVTSGITVVVAAGNNGADACNYSPARVAGAVTVGATDSTDTRASYSNYGTCLDIFAPGSSITSLWFGKTATKTISGTSMASPHVAGEVARILGDNPGMTPANVLAKLINDATQDVVKLPGTGSPNLFLFGSKLK